MDEMIAKIIEFEPSLTAKQVQPYLMAPGFLEFLTLFPTEIERYAALLVEGYQRGELYLG